MTHNPDEVNDAMHYIFEEYNQAKDGNMTRKEFFTFLWELKQNVKQSLNEGQMMSCWLAVSRKKDSVTFEEFKDGLEICYENQFFAKENDAQAPVLVVDDTKSYDTLRFKQSTAVKAFDKILEDEAKTREKPKPNFANKPSMGGPMAISREPRGDRPPIRERPPVNAATKPEGFNKDRPPVTLNNFSARIDLLQKEREVKKMEAQKKMDQIMALRYQEQKKQRELQRQQQDEEKNRLRTKEAEALVAEPAWMQNLKAKKKI